MTVEEIGEIERGEKEEERGEAVYLESNNLNNEGPFGPEEATTSTVPMAASGAVPSSEIGAIMADSRLQQAVVVKTAIFACKSSPPDEAPAITQSRQDLPESRLVADFRSKKSPFCPNKQFGAG
jgi:hypothetical protein